MATTTEVAIVGGGAAGCAVAYYLARSGVRSTIIEREGIGSQASGYSAGGLNPLHGMGIPAPLGPLAIESFRMHVEEWDRLSSESSVDFHPRVLAVIEVAFEEAELPGLHKTLDIFDAAKGFSAHWLGADELRMLEPRLSHHAIRGLYTHGNAALDSHLYTLALSKAAESLGATIHPGTAIGLTHANGRATGVMLEDGEIGCGSVVVATGPWSGEAGRWLGTPMPVDPLKGELLRLETPGPALAHDFTSAGVSLFHREDGLVWVGTTEERRGFDTKPSLSARRSLLARAAKLMPAIAQARLVMQTACLRPVTPDSLPIIGRAPHWENVYVATGAEKKGILLAPAMGKAIADVIARGSTQLPIGAFSPERFAPRH